jgi:tetratricopeptide (TPR) repeat protein
VLERQLKPALSEACAALKLARTSLLARVVLADALLFAGRAQEVVDLLKADTLDQPAASPLLTRLARAYVALDQIEQAEDVAKKAAADRDNASAQTTYGVLSAANRHRQEAEAAFQAAVNASTDLASARVGLSGIEIERGRLRQALSQVQGALERDPGLAQAYNNLGVIFAAQGRLQPPGRRKCDPWAATEPSDEPLPLPVAETPSLASAPGDPAQCKPPPPDNAVDAFLRAIERYPGYALAHANLALTYLELNCHAEALSEGQLALETGERSAIVHTLLARIYLRLHRYDRALAELRRAEALDPEYPLLQFYLAQIYRLQGRDRDGVRAILRGVSLDPSTMVEQRQYAQRETTQSGGSELRHHDLRADGHGDVGRLSYLVSGLEEHADSDRPNSDRQDGFLEGILGYQPCDYHNIVLFTDHLDERGGRPGLLFGPGLVQAPDFRRDFTESDWHLLDRAEVGRRSHVTVKGAFRHSGVFGDSPPTADVPNDILVRRFAVHI